MARFDLNLLGALHALLTERNVTRAGDRLHVTQPTMSGKLQRLRHQFGDEILVRVGRNMELTPLGQSLIEPVREALRGIEALAAAEPEFDPATSARTFAIMASDYCALTFLPRLVRRLAAIAPGIRLEIKPLHSPVDRVLAGEIDMCITSDDFSFLNHAGERHLLHSQVLYSDEFVCVVSEDHPLNPPISMNDYLLYPHVGVQMEGIDETIVAASIRRHVSSYKPTYTVPEFMVVPHIVAGSAAIGVVQKRLALMFNKSLPLKMFPPPFLIPNINETLLWYPRHSCDPAYSWLRQILTREAEQEWRVSETRSSTRSYREKVALSVVV